MEALAITYILIGAFTVGFMHYKKYHGMYKEKLPVIFRLATLKRWLMRISITKY